MDLFDSWINSLRVYSVRESSSSDSERISFTALSILRFEGLRLKTVLSLVSIMEVSLLLISVMALALTLSPFSNQSMEE